MSIPIRQVHRWLSIAFTLSVIAYVIVMSRGPVPVWLNIFPAGSLILMFLTGAWLFARPYVARRGTSTPSLSSSRPKRSRSA